MQAEDIHVTTATSPIYSSGPSAECGITQRLQCKSVSISNSVGRSDTCYAGPTVLGMGIG